MIETARTWALLRELRAPRTAGERDGLQRRLLRESAAHAYESVSFYRRHWDEAGFDPARFDGDVAAIPLTRPDAARAAIESGELLARDAELRVGRSYRTNGSSGRELHVVRGPLEQRVWRAAGLRAWLEHGYRWTDLTLRFDSQAGPDHPLQRVGISRTLWISNELPLEQRAAILADRRPEVVVGTPTVLRRVAAVVERERLAVRTPRILFSQGELLDSRTCAAVERVFGVAPVDLYGMTETGYLAWQCRERGPLHVNAEAFLVEVLRDDRPAGPGELGRVVVTDLRGRTMPLLRYETGDLALAGGERCPCGYTGPLLERTEGRTRASLVTRDGRVVTTREVVEALAPDFSPEEFRVEQPNDGAVRLEVAAGAHPGRAAKALAGLLGEPEVPVGETLRELPETAQKTVSVRTSVPFVLS